MKIILLIVCLVVIHNTSAMKGEINTNFKGTCKEPKCGDGWPCTDKATSCKLRTCQCVPCKKHTEQCGNSPCCSSLSCIRNKCIKENEFKQVKLGEYGCGDQGSVCAQGGCYEGGRCVLIRKLNETCSDETGYICTPKKDIKCFNGTCKKIDPDACLTKDTQCSKDPIEYGHICCSDWIMFNSNRPDRSERCNNGTCGCSKTDYKCQLDADCCDTTEKCLRSGGVKVCRHASPLDKAFGMIGVRGITGGNTGSILNGIVGGGT